MSKLTQSLRTSRTHATPTPLLLLESNCLQQDLTHPKLLRAPIVAFPPKRVNSRPNGIQHCHKSSATQLKRRILSPYLQNFQIPKHQAGPPFFELPALLPCKALIQQRQDLWHVELYILEIKRLLVVLLHFEKIVELEI